MAHNKIAQVPHGFFQICPKIESLIMSNNLISTLPWTMNLLTKMTEVDLSCNRLSDEALEQAFPPSVKLVNLANNQLRRVPEWIYSSKVLETIDLSSNQLTNWND